MHPEIEAAVSVTQVFKQLPVLNKVTMQNAEKLLRYIEDLNLERSGKFIPTLGKSLYMQWIVADWEFHLECVQNGRIFYSFCKADAEPVSGNDNVDEFIDRLEGFLLQHLGKEIIWCSI